MSWKIKPIGIKKVKIDDKFWSPRREIIRNEAIPYQWNVLNDSIPGVVPSHAIENFKIASGQKKGEFKGRVFQDSDVAKWIEAAAYSLATNPDPELEKVVDEVVELVEKSQQSDGYLDTYFSIDNIDKRWINLKEFHELYCAGHMIEAAVAYYETADKTRLLEVVCRLADHIDSVFGTEEGKKRGYPGHPEIELALVKLYKATGERRYLDLSKYFIDERGQEPNYFLIEEKERNSEFEREGKRGFHLSHYSAHVPVRKMTAAGGHAVRATYLYCAMVDIAAEAEDEELAGVCKKLWENVTKRQMYITGGIGSSRYGEAFSFDYDLPNDTAYAETCAAIGLFMWAHRMLQYEPDRKYSDIMERALYNGVISGISLDGKKYFYVNPLEVWPQACKDRADKEHIKVERQKWFECACCPANVSRIMTSLGQYIYSHSEDEIYVHLYISGQSELEMGGQKVAIEQEGNYPWDGNINFTVKTEQSSEFALALRIPGWCNSAELFVNGTKVEIEDLKGNGYVKVKRVWQNNDVVRLNLPMNVDVIRSNPNVRANAGKVAIQRGPLVYCIEEADNGNNLSDITIETKQEFNVHFNDSLLNGIATISGKGYRSDNSLWDGDLYKNIENNKIPCAIQAIPYYSWANREAGEMTVWIRENKD